MKKIISLLLAFAMLAGVMCVPAFAEDITPTKEGNLSFAKRSSTVKVNTDNSIDTTANTYESINVKYDSDTDGFSVGSTAESPQFVRVELDIAAGAQDALIRFLPDTTASAGTFRTGEKTINANTTKHLSALLDLKVNKLYAYLGEEEIKSSKGTAYDANATTPVTAITQSAIFIKTTKAQTGAITISNAKYYTYNAITGYTAAKFQAAHLPKVTTTAAATVVSRNNQTGKVTSNTDGTYTLSRTGGDGLVGVTVSHPSTTYNEGTAAYTMVTLDIEQLQNIQSFKMTSSSSVKNASNNLDYADIAAFKDTNRFHNVTIITDLANKKIYYYGDGQSITASNNSVVLDGTSSEKYDVRFYSDQSKNPTSGAVTGEVVKVSNAKYTVYSCNATLTEIQNEAAANAARIAELNKGTGETTVAVYPVVRGNLRTSATEATVTKPSNNNASLKFNFPYTVKSSSGNVKYLHFTAKAKAVTYTQGINNLCVEGSNKQLFSNYFVINDTTAENKIDVIYDVANKKMYTYFDGYYAGSADNSEIDEVTDIAVYYRELTNNTDETKEIAKTNFSDCKITYYYTDGGGSCTLDTVKTAAGVVSSGVKLNGIVVTAPSDAAENGNRVYPALHGENTDDYVLYIGGYEDGKLKEVVAADKAMVNIMPAESFKAYFWKKDGMKPQNGIIDITLQTTVQ